MNRRQMLMLTLPLMANLSTLAEDGAPRNAPVWFIWEEGVLWMLGDEGGSSVTRRPAAFTTRAKA